MTTLRALVLTPDFPPAHGGIQRLAHRLVTHLEGFEVRVLTLAPSNGPSQGGDEQIDVRRVPTGPDRRAAIVRLNAAALMEARQFRPDVVLVMHVVAGPAASAIRRVLRVPVVTYLHAKEVPRRKRLARYVVRHSDRIVAVSRYTAGLAVAAGADPARMEIIPPGVDWHEPPLRERLETPTVVTVSRLEDRYKGHDVMVRAMPLVRSRVRGARWVVVGDGPLRPEIERMANALRLRDAIHLCGEVSDADRDTWLDRAHVFAMPSRVPAGGAGEGFGIVFLEAGVHALPVVGGRIGGALDSVVDEVTGLLVDPTDHTEVGQAISLLLLDRQLAAQMGRAGSQRASEFAWPKIAKRVGELLEETAVVG
jgi:phosphatidyl-myo-inositol dimannoside synthase